jgi:type IV secretion system protein VirB6
MQQGGMGLLLTALIVSVPPMAAMFFQGTLGSFLTYSAFAGAGGALGPNGQPTGAWSAHRLAPGDSNYGGDKDGRFQQQSGLANRISSGQLPQPQPDTEKTGRS